MIIRDVQSQLPYLTGNIFGALAAAAAGTLVTGGVLAIDPVARQELLDEMLRLGLASAVYDDEVLLETDILLVVIGRRWMGSARPGNSRIQDDADPVPHVAWTAVSA